MAKHFKNLHFSRENLNIPVFKIHILTQIFWKTSKFVPHMVTYRFGQLFGILQTIIYEKNCKKPIRFTQNFIKFFLRTYHEIKENHPNFPNWHVTKLGTNFEGFQKIWVKMCILQTGIFRYFLEKWRFLNDSGHVHMVLNS